jgi:hypothetical protein
VTTSSTRANAPSTTVALASKTRAVVSAVLRRPIRTRPLLRAAAGCASDLDTRKGTGTYELRWRSRERLTRQSSCNGGCEASGLVHVRRAADNPRTTLTRDV